MGTFFEYLNSLDNSRKEIAREAVAEYLRCSGESTNKIDSSFAIYEICKDMSVSEIEYADILISGQSYDLIKRIRIAQGGITATYVDKRIILKHCLINDATCVALVHNHPSGSSRPSRDDNELTENVKKACDFMGIYFIDHIVIGASSYYSYRDNNKI